MTFPKVPARQQAAAHLHASASSEPKLLVTPTDFYAPHTQPGPLVLPNAWDAASAALFQRALRPWRPPVRHWPGRWDMPMATPCRAPSCWRPSREFNGS